jgi:hypothetical protein
MRWDVLQGAQASSVFTPVPHGLRWDIGGSTFGLAMLYLDLSMGCAIAKSVGVTNRAGSGRDGCLKPLACRYP